MTVLFYIEAILTYNTPKKRFGVQGSGEKACTAALTNGARSRTCFHRTTQAPCQRALTDKCGMFRCVCLLFNMCIELDQVLVS
jgi:hypothetical protein